MMAVGRYHDGVFHHSVLATTTVSDFESTVDSMTFRQERRVFVVDGRRRVACVSVECWQALQEISLCEGLSLDRLIADIVRRSGRRSLSLELDLYALSYFHVPSAPLSLWQAAPANLLPC